MVDIIMSKQEKEEDCTEVEEELNRMIYSIYGLDDHDIAIIEKEWS